MIFKVLKGENIMGKENAVNESFEEVIIFDKPEFMNKYPINQMVITKRGGK